MNPEVTQLRELCPQCSKARLTLIRLWTQPKRAWVECATCGYSEERTFANGKLK